MTGEESERPSLLQGLTKRENPSKGGNMSEEEANLLPSRENPLSRATIKERNHGKLCEVLREDER